MPSQSPFTLGIKDASIDHEAHKYASYDRWSGGGLNLLWIDASAFHHVLAVDLMEVAPHHEVTRVTWLDVLYESV